MSESALPTVLHRLNHWAEQHPASIAMRYKTPVGWEGISASEFRDRVFYLCLFLESKGVTSDDVGVILSYNRPEWAQMDLAVLMLGAKSAGLYPNSAEKDIHYIIKHTEAKILSVQNREYWEKLGTSELPDHVETVIVFDGDTSISSKAISFEEAVAIGRKLAEEKTIGEYLERIDPRAGAFLIYTSGTTGDPKGALLTHENLVFTSDLAIDYWKLPSGAGDPERQGWMFSFLPLCHVAEKLQSIGVGISGQYVVSYCSKFENLATDIAEVQPTVLLCVPRLWEKMMEGVETKIANGKGAKKHLAVWALGVGKRVAEAKFSGRSASPLDLIQLKLADKLVLSKVKQALGLERASLVASGAAPLRPNVAKWFRALGFDILEDFGQTESTGVICMTEPGVEMTGSVGKPVPGTEFKIAEDGEILTRGKHVFLGYFKNDEATKDTIDSEGWLHTGDLGVINDKGCVVIKGRKKEIMKTSGGKMVAPLPIEESLKADPAISQVCMVGDGRKYFSALVTLSEDQLASLDGSTSGETIEAGEVVHQVQAAVDRVNTKLGGFEQIKKFKVLSRDFSIESGEMTPTLKMKRAVIEDHFKGLIDEMYR